MLSIIIPTYNAEKYLVQTLDSIAAENLSGQVEVILTDDGSTDNTRHIIKEYAERYKWVRFYLNDHLGPGGARNFGVSVAKGEYVMFVDSDDYLAEGWGKTVALCLENEEEPDVICLSSQIQQKNNHRVVTGVELLDLIKAVTAVKTEQFNASEFTPGPHSKMYKRTLLIDNNIQFPLDVLNGEDLLFNVEVLSKVKSVMLYLINFYVYRNNPNSLINSVNPKLYDSNIRFVQLLEAKLAETLVPEQNAIVNYWRVLMIFENFNRIYPFDQNMGRIMSDKQVVKTVLADKPSKNIINDNISSKRQLLLHSIKSLPYLMTKQLVWVNNTHGAQRDEFTVL